MSDTLNSVVRPSLKQEGDPPEHVSQRGGDVRGFDRRLVDEDGKPRLVLGPSHHFEEPSDALLENGLWRVWPGPRGYVPFLYVEAFRSGEWHHAGVLSFERNLDDKLLGARLLRMTPDIGVLALNVSGVGEVLVTLRRGERMDRIQHGGNRLPQVSVARYVRWRGIPPFEQAPFGSESGVYLYLPGGDSSASAPDSAGLSITGDGDWRAAITPNDWTPGTSQTILAQYRGTGDERAIIWRIDTDGTLQWIWSEDGTSGTQTIVNSTAAPTVDDGELLLVRVTHDVDNGASGNDVTFYTKTSTQINAHADALDDSGWTQLGAVVTTAGTTSIHDSSEPFYIGVTDATARELIGRVLAVVMKDPIEGTTVASPDFTAQVPYSRSFDDDQGNTWTINGDAEIVGTGTHTGKFDGGVSGHVKWPWPSRLAGDWGFAFWWLPANGNTNQADSGLLSIFDTAGDQVGKVEWLADTDRIRFTLGADAIEITGLTFSANDPIFVSATFSTDDGMGLTVNDSSTQHASDAAATTEPADLDALYWGLISDGTSAGDGDAGDGLAGGVVLANGVVDNLQGFVGFMSEAERATLAGATSGLDGLPSPLSRLVFYAPVDVEPVPIASDLTTGRRYEVDPDGSRLAHDGLTKALGVLDDEGIEMSGLSLGQNVAVLDVAAFLATTDTNDDLADHHAQFSTDQEQEVRAR